MQSVSSRNLKVITPGEKLRGEDKVSRIPIKVNPTPKGQLLRKPRWIRASFSGTAEVMKLKSILREKGLHTVCEEAACPNLGECFGNGTVTFLVMGDICTRRCPFCDVAHGRPKPLDKKEPGKLASAIAAMRLKYVVITSVDRDDLRDGGAAHFVDCIREIRRVNPNTRIEILTPDFRGRLDIATEILAKVPADIFNHNLETIPRLYKQVRPGSDYLHSLQLLRKVKSDRPDIVSKSGLMLGLGEKQEEVIAVMKDMRNYDTDMITLGQYLQPSPYHLPVTRYWTPEEFKELGKIAQDLGFANAASGPMVRSSYHADLQAHSS